MDNFYCFIGGGKAKAQIDNYIENYAKEMGVWKMNPKKIDC